MIRALLMYGSNIDILNNDLQKPIDLSKNYFNQDQLLKAQYLITNSNKIKLKFQEDKLSRIANKRRKLSNSRGLDIQFINKSKRTIKKLQKNTTLMKLYFAVYFSSIVFKFASIWPLLTPMRDYWWEIPLLIDIFVIKIYLITFCIDPGYVINDMKKGIPFI